MGAYNLLQTSLTCPRCQAMVDTTVDCHFGEVNQMQELKIGDRYPWVAAKTPSHGGRPEQGNLDGEGYMECPICHKDAYLHIQVRNDVIATVMPHPQKPGHIPD